MLATLLLAAAVQTPSRATAHHVAVLHTHASKSDPSSGVVSGRVSLTALVGAFALRHGYNFSPLPGTPDVVEPFDLGASNDLVALNRILDIYGLAQVVKDGVMYLGTAPALDATLHTTLSQTIVLSTNGADPQSIVANKNMFAPPGIIMIPNERDGTIIVRGTGLGIYSVKQALQGMTSPYKMYAIRLINGISPLQAVSQLSMTNPPVAPEHITPDPANSQVLVYGTPDYYNQVRQELALIDRPLGQVFYSISIYEVDPKTFNSVRGLQVGQAQQNYQSVGNTAVASVAPPINGSIITGFPFAFNIAAKLDELESKGQATILRRSDLVATNGTTASTDVTLDVGFEVPNPYTGIPSPHSVRTGVVFTVTPYIGNGTITTDVKASISDIKEFDSAGLPDITSRDTNTQVVTAPNDAIVLSGLYAKDMLDTRTGIPPLNHLFFIGKLFQHNQYNEDESEIVVVLRPHLMRGLDHHVPVTYPHIPKSVINNGIQPTPAPNQ